jgi:hypothetical protein
MKNQNQDMKNYEPFPHKVFVIQSLPVKLAGCVPAVLSVSMKQKKYRIQGKHIN